MTKLLKYVTTAGVIVMALQSSMALAQSPSADAVTTPSVPVNLQVPDGNTLFVKGHAQGTQNYVCLPSPSASGFSWTFFSPQATVLHNFKFLRGTVSQQIITHFLSPNPAENGTARVTWQSSIDTSAVWGKALQTSVDPDFVAAGAIPWVLLQEVGTQRGPTGGEILANTTYVQRLNTEGGAAPATGCTQAENVGATILVPYTAEYFFYRANSK